MKSDKVRLTRSPRMAEAVQDALLRAGQTLFSDHAVDAVAIDDIVREAGVAKGSFYKYFPDKEALLTAVTNQIRNRVEAEVSAANEGVTDAAHRVVRGMCVYLRFVAQEPEQGGVLVRNDRGGQTSPAMQLNQGTMDDVALGLTQGRFTISTVEVATLFILGVAHAGLMRFNGDRGAAGNIWIAQELCQFVLHAFGLPREEARLIAAQTAEEILRRPRTMGNGPLPDQPNSE